MYTEKRYLNIVIESILIMQHIIYYIIYIQ